jgi:hypothetical protein
VGESLLELFSEDHFESYELTNIPLPLLSQRYSTGDLRSLRQENIQIEGVPRALWRSSNKVLVSRSPAPQRIRAANEAHTERSKEV